MRQLVKFGTTLPMGGSRIGWVAVNEANLATQQSGDLLLGGKCSSLAQIRETVDRIRADLDRVLAEAEKAFSSN
jgi:hypothetical protein